MLPTGRSASAALVLPTGRAPPAIAALHCGVLPLRHRNGVHDTTACAEAPFADMHDDGGDGIGGPHSRPCHARVVSHDGALRIESSGLDAGAGPAKRVGTRLTRRCCEPLPAGRT